MKIQIAPSILSADFVNLENEVKKISNADWVHVDVMDAHFVPNLTIGLPVVKRLAQVSPIPLDIHLMISDPDTWAPQYAQAGAKSVTFHLEASKAPIRLARALRAQGVRAGVALKPATPVEEIADFLDEFDMVLIMTVEPGFGGQAFIEGCVPKIQRARKLIGDRDIWLEVDGGVDTANIGDLVKAGADMFVAGSAVFGTGDPATNVSQLRDCANQAASNTPDAFSETPASTAVTQDSK